MSLSTSKSKLPPALLGEALHVYTVKNLLNNSSLKGNERKVLEGIVSMIPNEVGAVSGSFLMKLLKIALSVNASSSMMEELVKRVGMQLDEVTIAELESVELGVVEAVVESFFQGFIKERREEKERLTKVVKLFDEYLVIAARKEELSMEKFMELVEMVPRMAREEHDGLYRAIDTFLQAHADISKADRRCLCRMIDCGKLSREVRTEAITNDRLPLRMLVQLLFVEQERANRDNRNPGNSLA